MKVIGKISVGRNVIRISYLITIVLNILLFLLVAEEARYTSGGLTGASGVIYFLAHSMDLFSMVLLVRQRMNAHSDFSFLWAGAVAISFAGTIDGLASAMTLSAFCFLIIRDISFNNIIAISIGVIAALFIFYLGFQGKFSGSTGHLTPAMFSHWTIARLSISAEQGYRYLDGGSVLNISGQYLDILKRSFSYRIDILMGKSPVMLVPRSVSEAFYYDMYGSYNSGSSPGFFLGIIINGIMSIPILYFVCLVFTQLFADIQKRLSVLHLFALVLLTKAIWANVTEFMILISPNVLALFVFMFAILIDVKPRLGAYHDT